jgi:hypothetical protein
MENYVHRPLVAGGDFFFVLVPYDPREGMTISAVIKRVGIDRDGEKPKPFVSSSTMRSWCDKHGLGRCWRYWRYFSAERRQWEQAGESFALIVFRDYGGLPLAGMVGSEGRLITLEEHAKANAANEPRPATNVAPVERVVA